MVAASVAAARTGDASQITSWVESHFTSETIGGVTVYDLTRRLVLSGMRRRAQPSSSR